MTLRKPELVLFDLGGRYTEKLLKSLELYNDLGLVVSGDTLPKENHNPNHYCSCRFSDPLCSLWI